MAFLPGRITRGAIFLCYQDFPSEPPQFLLISQVPGSILGKLLAPETQSGFRLSAAPGVLVPETTMHKDDLAESRKLQVGLARQIAAAGSQRLLARNYKARRLILSSAVLWIKLS